MPGLTRLCWLSIVLRIPGRPLGGGGSLVLPDSPGTPRIPRAPVLGPARPRYPNMLEEGVARAS